MECQNQFLFGLNNIKDYIFEKFLKQVAKEFFLPSFLVNAPGICTRKNNYKVGIIRGFRSQIDKYEVDIFITKVCGKLSTPRLTLETNPTIRANNKKRDRHP